MEDPDSCCIQGEEEENDFEPPSSNGIIIYKETLKYQYLFSHTFHKVLML